MFNTYLTHWAVLFFFFFLQNKQLSHILIPNVSFRCTEKWCIRICSSSDSSPLQITKIQYVCVHACSVASVMSGSLRSARLLCPQDFSGKNTGVSCPALLQGIFLTQGLTPHDLIFCGPNQNTSSTNFLYHFWMYEIIQESSCEGQQLGLLCRFYRKVRACLKPGWCSRLCIYS